MSLALPLMHDLIGKIRMEHRTDENSKRLGKALAKVQARTSRSREADRGKGRAEASRLRSLKLFREERLSLLQAMAYVSVTTFRVVVALPPEALAPKANIFVPDVSHPTIPFRTARTRSDRCR